MVFSKRYLWILILLPLALGAWDLDKGRIHIDVKDEQGQGLEWVNVMVIQDRARLTGGQTNQWGRVALVNIPPGSYRLRFSRIQYESVDSLDIQVAADSVTSVNVIMKEDTKVIIMH